MSRTSEKSSSSSVCVLLLTSCLNWYSQWHWGRTEMSREIYTSECRWVWRIPWMKGSDRFLIFSHRLMNEFTHQLNLKSTRSELSLLEYRGTIFLRGNDCVFSSYREEMKRTIDWSDQCKMLICDLIVNLNRSIGGKNEVMMLNNKNKCQQHRSRANSFVSHRWCHHRRPSVRWDDEAKFSFRIDSNLSETVCVDVCSSIIDRVSILMNVKFNFLFSTSRLDTRTTSIETDGHRTTDRPNERKREA